MTSFDIAALTPELNQTIKGTRIDNIYQINPTTLLLKLRKPSAQLIIEAGKRLHLTSYTLEKPEKPPAFCMALRKCLRNAEVKEVQQHEFERIIVIKLSMREGDFQLISELFGEGNIILVSPENKILHALTYRRMRDRNILRGEVFQHPPSSGRNSLRLSRQDFGEIKSLEKLEIVRALTKFLSIGGLYAEEILLRAQVEKSIPAEALTEPEIDRIFEQLQQLLSTITSGNVKPCIVLNEQGEWVDVTPILLEKYVQFKHKTYSSFNEALDEYYTEMTLKEKGVEVSKEVKQELARQQRVLESQRKALEDSRNKVEQNRKIGDAIYAHFNDLQFLLEKIMNEKRDGKPWNQIVTNIGKEKAARLTPAIHFHSLESQRLTLNVTVDDLTFPLSLHRSIQANAANYYEKAKKAQNKLEGVEKALRETQTKIEETQQKEIKEVREVSKPLPKRREKAWYEKFRWFHSSNGFLVIGGRDATTNEILIKKHTEPHDIVFHADIIGAPFVVIKTEGKPPTEQTIKEAAQFAASYSRAWREMMGTVGVYWVSPQQVNKSPPPGQSLKKGSFMIHGRKNYVRNVPLRVAIGVRMEEERPSVIGGPTDAIAKQTNIHVQMIPGKQKSGDLAKQIQQLLIKKAPKHIQKQILEVPLGEIQQFIPLGKGQII